MSNPVVVNHAQYCIMPTPPVVGNPPVKLIALTVTSGKKISSQLKDAALDEDLMSQVPVTIGYTNGPYTVPGTLLWDGKLLYGKQSVKYKKQGNGVISSNVRTGDIFWKVINPAKMPSPPGTPDSTLQYPGTWSLIDPGQTKLTVID